jgi:hypothetical protein
MDCIICGNEIKPVKGAVGLYSVYHVRLRDGTTGYKHKRCPPKQFWFCTNCGSPAELGSEPMPTHCRTLMCLGKQVTFIKQKLGRASF